MIKARPYFRTCFVVAGSLSILFDSAKTNRRYEQGFVRIEPELNSTFHPQTEPRSDKSAAGGGYVSIAGWERGEPNYGRRIAGETAYKAKISAPCMYYVWIRARWLGECANSITLLVRSAKSGNAAHERQERYLVGNDANYLDWHWVRGPTIRLEQGEHEILLGTRESAAWIDAIILTTNPYAIEDP